MGPLMEKVTHFVCQLEGSYERIWEIHWNLYAKGRHETCADVMETLEDYIDRIMESSMGIEERPGFDWFVAIKPSSTNLEEICKTLRMKSDQLAQDLCYNPAYTGIVNILNDFSSDLAKYSYVATLA